MLKKITEPQALYQKSHTDGSVETPAVPAAASASKPPKKKINSKLISMIVAISLFAVVGVAGIMIAQRQQNQPGPVAPNAPESRPDAATTPVTNLCSLSFSVTAPPVAEPAGTAVCSVKQAMNEQGNTYADKQVVAKGAVIEYTLTIVAAKETQGSVVVTDTIPSQLTYVPDSASPKPTVSGNKLTFDLGVMAKGNNKQTVIVRYKAKVKATGTAGLITNSAQVITGGKATTASNCATSLTYPAAPTGKAVCESKVAFNAAKAPLTNLDLVKRGATIEYKITVSAEKETAAAATVTDKLPAALEYVAGSSKVDGQTFSAVTYDAATNTLTYPLGVLAKSGSKQTVVIVYKTKVKTDAAIANFANTVSVKTGTTTATTPAACKVTLKVAPEGIAQCEDKSVWTDYTGTEIQHESVVKRGDTLVYKLKVSADQLTKGTVKITDKLPATVEFVEAKSKALTYNAAAHTLTADLGTMGTTTKEILLEFKVKVKANAAAGDFTNTATVSTAGANQDPCSVSLRIAYACNSSCVTDAQCQSGNQNFICSTEQGNKCRLSSNTSSETCEGLAQTFSCNSSCQTDDQCKTANSNYTCASTSEGKRCRLATAPTQASCQAPTAPTPTPTPVIGCNQICSTNADCSNSNHICYSTDDGSQRCRLDTNPQSSSCTTAVATTTTPTQPELPEELPQSGPENWVNWLKAGLVTLGIGALLLLLL